MDSKEPLIDQPGNWAELIQAQLRQSVSGALQAIDALIVKNHIPRVNHFQLLLYLVLMPSAAADQNTVFVPSALSLLYRLLSLHKAGTLAPLIPSVERQEWIDWPNHADNLRRHFSRRVRVRMESCESDGVWALLYKRTKDEMAEEMEKWDEWREEDAYEGDKAPGRNRRPPRRDSKRRSRRSSGDLELDDEDADDQADVDERSEADGDEDGDDDDPRVRAVKPTAWDLLPFLNALWEKDARENDGIPVAFLWQFWRPSPDLQYDQLEPVVGILQEAVYNCPPSEAAVRHRIAASLLRLLIQAASGDRPSVIPRQLVSTLLPLFRHPRVAILIGTLRAPLPAYGYQSIAPEAITHLLAHAIEDAAGVRTKREAARRAGGSRRRGGRPQKAPASTQFEGTGLAPPLVEYAISLLDLDSKAQNDDPDDMTAEDREKNMHALKLALVATLVRIRPSELWYDVEDPRYMPMIRAMLPKDEMEETEPTLRRDSLADERASSDEDMEMSQAQLEEAAQEDALDEEMGMLEDDEMDAQDGERTDGVPSQDVMHDDEVEEEDIEDENGREDDESPDTSDVRRDDIDIEITTDGDPPDEVDSDATEPTLPLDPRPKRSLRHRRSSPQAEGLRRSARLR